MHRRRPEGAGPGGNLKTWKPADRVGSAGVGSQARQIRQISRTASHNGPGCLGTDSESVDSAARCGPASLGSLAKLETCRPARPGGDGGGERGCLASPPDCAPAWPSRGGHDDPHGRPPRGASGAREVRSLDASARSRVRSSPWAARASLGDH